MYALVLADKVLQVEENVFDVHPDYQWIKLDGTKPVKAGWSYTNNEFIEPPTINYTLQPSLLEQKVNALWHWALTADNSEILTLNNN